MPTSNKNSFYLKQLKIIFIGFTGLQNSILINLSKNRTFFAEIKKKLKVQTKPQFLQSIGKDSKISLLCNRAYANQNQTNINCMILLV